MSIQIRIMNREKKSMASGIILISENMDSEGMEFPNHSCGGSSNLKNFHIGESSRSAAAMDTCETDGISCLRVVPNDPCAVVSFGYAAMDSKVGCHFRAASRGPLIGVRSSKNLASM